MTGNRSWALLDQTLSSISNFLPGLYAAHVLSPDDFGVFALVQVAYVLALGACRAAFVEPAIVARADVRPTREHLGAVDSVHALALMLALVAGAALAAGAPAVMWLAMVGMVIALGQDALRMVSIATGRARDAAINDGCWVAALLVLLPAAATFGVHSTWAVTALWVLAAAPGWLYGMIRNRWVFSLARARWLLGEQAGRAAAFLADWGLKQGATTVSTYAIGLLGGLTTVAGIRAAQLVLGPINILFTGLQAALLPESVRVRDTDLDKLRGPLNRLALVLGGLSIAAGLLFALLPHSVLVLLVGEQANGLAKYVLPMSCIVGSTGLMTGSHLGLRALQAGRELVTTRAAGSLVTLGCGAAGYAVFRESIAGLWGLALGGLIAAALWHRAFDRAFRAAANAKAGAIAR